MLLFPNRNTRVSRTNAKAKGNIAALGYAWCIVEYELFLSHKPKSDSLSLA